jgi:hypothetical protein
MRNEPTDATPEPKPSEPSEPEDSERSRFARFAKKLVRVPKKELDEKAEEWKRERGRER